MGGYTDRRGQSDKEMLQYGDEDENLQEMVMVVKDNGMKGGPRKIKVKKGSSEDRAFAASRREELKCLIRDGTFVKLKEAALEVSPRIFCSSFFNELKKVGNNLKRKSRLVAQNYENEGAASISIKAPTVQLFLHLLSLFIASLSLRMTRYTCDVTQDYIQSHTSLEPQFFIRAPREINLKAGHVLKVLNPLYGIPESGLNFLLNYLRQHL